MKVLRYWIPAIAYMGLIFALSSVRIVAPLINEFPFRDKGVHFIEYLVLGFLCAYATRHAWPTRSAVRTLALAAFFSAAWGFSDELHQAFVPGRSADALDLLADALGGTTGALAFGLFTRFRAPTKEAT